MLNQIQIVKRLYCNFRTHPEISLVPPVMVCIMYQLQSPSCKPNSHSIFHILISPVISSSQSSTLYCLHNFDYCRSAWWVGGRCLKFLGVIFGEKNRCGYLCLMWSILYSQALILIFFSVCISLLLFFGTFCTFFKPPIRFINVLPEGV